MTAATGANGITRLDGAIGIAIDIVLMDIVIIVVSTILPVD